MKIVLIGDIGWANFYHLGDEAMTDAALGELATRGICDITVIAGDPEYAATEKGFPAVKRFGYRMGSRNLNAKRMTAILSHAKGDSTLPIDDQAIETIKAVQEADAVLIAGGVTSTRRLTTTFMTGSPWQSLPGCMENHTR